MERLKAPFPYFGGKSRIADVVWRAFGRDVRHYIEPFFGSGAVLLARPLPFDGVETVNDKDGMVANFWRALQHDPEQVAYWADWPVNENDLHARHIWLVNRKESLQERLEGDPDFYDAKIAGWWVWGISCWIGGHWCARVGPWQSVNGRFVRLSDDGGRGVHRRLPHLGDGGRGVHRRLPHLRTFGSGVNRKCLVSDESDSGHYGACAERTACLLDYFQQLADRLRYVRVCCGDWTRVCSSKTTLKVFTPCAVFLDPPYSQSERHKGLYVADEDGIAARVREWAIAHGDDPQMRIALCGYEGEHAMPDGWTEYAWVAHGGYAHRGNGRGRINRKRERVWFSPHCLPLEQPETEWALPLMEAAG